MVKRDGELTVQTLTLVFTLLMFCSWITDAVGIYAVFGAFIIGTAMPRGEFAEQLRDKLGTAYASRSHGIFDYLSFIAHIFCVFWTKHSNWIG